MSFKFPPIYSFPPFWTVQPCMEAKRMQTQTWCDLILSWCKANKKEELKIADALKTDLFNNKSIGRALSQKDAEFFLDQLVLRQNASWADDKHTKCKIIFRKPAQWANIFYQWAVKNNSQGVVFTLYELREGDDTQSEAFHNMDQDVMLQAIECLVKEKKATLIKGENFDEHGVKFL